MISLTLALWLWAQQGKAQPSLLRYNYGTQSDPPDVPAVQEPTKEPPDCPNMIGGQPTMWHVNSGESLLCVKTPPLEWTCKDKRRILQMAENGDRWCHRPESK